MTAADFLSCSGRMIWSVCYEFLSLIKIQTSFKYKRHTNRNPSPSPCYLWKYCFTLKPFVLSDRSVNYYLDRHRPAGTRQPDPHVGLRPSFMSQSENVTSAHSLVRRPARSQFVSTLCLAVLNKLNCVRNSFHLCYLCENIKHCTRLTNRYKSDHYWCS